MQININCKSIPTSFDVVCSNCEWTGVATLDYPENVTTLSGVSLEIGNFCTLSALFNQPWFVRG